MNSSFILIAIFILRKNNSKSQDCGCLVILQTLPRKHQTLVSECMLNLDYNVSVFLNSFYYYKLLSQTFGRRGRERMVHVDVVTAYSKFKLCDLAME